VPLPRRFLRFANMPAFGDTLTPEEMTALVDYLGKRK
jgi:mono/diheme cytochrome c family protein